MSSKLPAAVAPPTGLLDLERELVCSICTETLYQPLTLLDCLHTFCGSCLKEWFTFEHNKSRSSSSASSRTNPYTCPTCRAQVKDARHNATVSTLLEMYLAANPGRGKSKEDKADIEKSYAPGENILPKLDHSGRRSRRREEEDRAEEEERRQLEEVRERSLRETRGTAAQVGARLTASVATGTSSRSRSRESREQRRRDDERREERRERRRRAEAAEAQLRERDAAPPAAPVTSLTTENLAAARLAPPTTSPRHPSAVEARQRERQIVPQTSLRSLMSSSESGAGTGDSMEAEQILQQIIEEGLLEGIDLHNLDSAQEDALSERIAEAYRQRHQNRSEQSSHLSPTDRAGRENGRSSDRNRVRERQQQAERRHHQRSHSAQGSSNSESRRTLTSEDRRPPVSRSRLPDIENTSAAHGRGASENERSQTSPTSQSHRPNSENIHSQATRSAVDLSDRQRTSEGSRATRVRRQSDTRRTNTEPEAIPSVTERWRRITQPGSLTSSADHLPLSQNMQLSLGQGAGPATTIKSSPKARHVAVAVEPTANSPTTTSHSTAAPVPVAPSTPIRPHSTIGQSMPQPSDPSISCISCSRSDIQHDLHKHCSQCSANICLRCYRTVPSSRLGCKPDSIAESAPNLSSPMSPTGIEVHGFTSRKYLRPDKHQYGNPENHSSSTNDTPSKDLSDRLQEGKFCDICYAFANTCYWSCDTCNKGDWGFCNSCINSHHCCTHPLLPLAHAAYAPKTPTLQQGLNPDSGLIKLTPSHLHATVLPTATTVRSHPSISSSAAEAATSADADYLPLTFTTNCDICTYPIRPSHTRFHCPSHPTLPSANDPPSTTSNTTSITSHNPVGDYDICTNCYLNLIKLRKVRKEDGPNGWRRCPQGHRMIVIGFEDAPEGQKRIVVNDLVGGHSLGDADIAALSSAAEAANGNVKSTSSPTSQPSTRGQWTWIEPSPKEGSSTTATTTTTTPGSAAVRRESRASRLLPRSHATNNNNNNPSSASPSPTNKHKEVGTKFPPDGGYGLRAVAGYPWFPEEGEEGAGELMFPRWAEIKEVEDINGEWWAGVYAGVQGVFPGGCVRIL